MLSQVVARLLVARVSAKHKQERQDTLAGLEQIYYRHFTQTKLKNIQAAGDDCDLDIILNCTRAAIWIDAVNITGSSRSKGIEMWTTKQILR
jgi:hypothetical protein